MITYLHILVFIVTGIATIAVPILVVKGASRFLPYREEKRLFEFTCDLGYRSRKDPAFLRFRNLVHLGIQLRNKVGVRGSEWKTIVMTIAIMVSITFTHIYGSITDIPIIFFPELFPEYRDFLAYTLVLGLVINLWFILQLMAVFEKFSEVTELSNINEDKVTIDLEFADKDAPFRVRVKVLVLCGLSIILFMVLMNI